MKILKYYAPFDATQALEQLEQIFGVEERLLEEVQLNGSETEFNTDIVYLAYENDVLLGMIHATIPCKTPYIAGLSAMFTTEAARGKGIGKILFSKIVEEVSQKGVRLSVLGTDNPIAAKLYSGYGFEFYPGSNVMARFSKGHTIDFIKDYYLSKKGTTKISRGNQAMRIPIIPLVHLRNFGVILDINTEIFNTSIITERSCMGLFPRYEKLRKCGGDYYTGFDEAGTLGIIGSVIPQPDNKVRGDFFSAPAFESDIPKMLEKIENNYTNVYFEIAANDKSKESHLMQNGYKVVGEGFSKIGDLMIQTLKFAHHQ